MNKQNDTDMEITFWGTRGTSPAPGKEFVRAGGHTNCVEVACGKHTLIFDAGTGIKMLGRKLIDSHADQHVHVLLTHAHFDHVEGIPFFAPFFETERPVDINCGTLDGSTDTEDVISGFMSRPYFPVGPDVFLADIEYRNFTPNDAFSFGEEIKIRTCPLNHPGGATAYRVDYYGKSFAYVTDTEHVFGKHDEAILELIDGVDTFVYDCSFLDKEMREYSGFGHSTHEEGLRLCNLAKAGGLRASHHMPYRTDDELDIINNLLRNEADNASVAYAGETIVLK